MLQNFCNFFGCTGYIWEAKISVKKSNERRIRVIGNLTSKEKLFCTYFSILRDGTQAAKKSGYRFAEISAAKLLGKDAVKKEIERLDKQRKANEQDITNGYFRLAFGCVSDAVGLLFSSEATKEQIDAMDLFNISEIKRKKGGEIEIKFFDRLKALEKLTELAQGTEGTTAGSFYAAIEKSAMSLKTQQDE